MNEPAEISETMWVWQTPSACTKWLQGALLAAFAGMLGACSSTLGHVDEQGVLAQLAFLQPGLTSGKDIEARFGAPSNLYEGGRVVTYQLDEDLKRSKSGPYRLVLVYQKSGLLEKWSLVDKGD